MDDDYIGLRVAAFRQTAGLSQQQLGDKIGKSQGYISQIENGRRTVATRRLLIALAEALNVATTDLTAAKPTGQPDVERPLHEAVPDIRAALDGAHDTEPPPGSLSVDRLMSARMNCDYEALARLAPIMLHNRLQVSEISEDPAAYQQFAETAFTISMVVRPLGYVDLATRLAERAQFAAARSGNPVTQAAAEFARAQCALAVGVRGLRMRSLTLATRAAEQVEQGAPDNDGLTWYGLLHLQAALAAGSLELAAQAKDHLDEAKSAAQRVFGDPWRMDFSAANVGVWEAATHLELGNPGKAIECARKVDRTKLRTPQRRSHLLIHLGRALDADNRREEAVAAFLEADRIAPAEVRGRSTVREAVGDMLRQARRKAGSPELQKLASNLGVDPLSVTTQ